MKLIFSLIFFAMTATYAGEPYQFYSNLPNNTQTHLLWYPGVSTHQNINISGAYMTNVLSNCVATIVFDVVSRSYHKEIYVRDMKRGVTTRANFIQGNDWDKSTATVKYLKSDVNKGREYFVLTVKNASCYRPIHNKFAIYVKSGGTQDQLEEIYVGN